MLALEHTTPPVGEGRGGREQQARGGGKTEMREAEIFPFFLFFFSLMSVDGQACCASPESAKDNANPHHNHGMGR